MSDLTLTRRTTITGLGAALATAALPSATLAEDVSYKIVNSDYLVLDINGYQASLDLSKIQNYGLTVNELATIIAADIRAPVLVISEPEGVDIYANNENHIHINANDIRHIRITEDFGDELNVLAVLKTGDTRRGYVHIDSLVFDSPDLPPAIQFLEPDEGDFFDGPFEIDPKSVDAVLKHKGYQPILRDAALKIRP